MCDCKSQLEASLLERFKSNEPDATGHVVKMMGYVFIMSGLTPGQKGCMAVEQEAHFPLKKGGTKRRVVKTNMIFTFCPFCGVKYDQVKEVEHVG